MPHRTVLTYQRESALTRSWKRLDGVDLIRGLAILFVLMNHVNMQLLFAHVPYTRGLPKQLVSSLVWNGQYGVQMFFAVSGFLITATSLRRWGSLKHVRPRDFYWIRFARIAPLFLLLLLVLSALHLGHVHNFVIRPEVATLRTALLAALTFRVNVLEATRGYLPGNWDILWSLSVEEMFYFFFPIACLVFKRVGLFMIVLGCFIVLGPFGRILFAHGNDVWQEYSYLGSMDAIAMGSLTAILLTRTHLQRAALVCLGICGTALVSFVLLFSLNTQAVRLERAGLDMSILALGTCMLIAVAAETGWRSPLALAPIRWMGQRSYEIYLSHMFVVIALSTFLVRAEMPNAAVPVLFLTVIAFAAIAGALVARVYVEPLNRWLRAYSSDDALRMGSVIGDKAVP